MKRDRYVYGLYAGDQPMPCYIGIGKGRRMFDHIKAASTGRLEGNKRKSLTLIACHKRKIHIIAYKLITNITLQEAYKHEKRLIAFYGRRDLKTGCLLNACAGGHGSKEMAPSTRKRLSVSQKERWQDQDYAEKLKATLRKAHSVRGPRGPQSQEWREAIAKSKRGGTLTPEHCAKLSLSHIGKKQPHKPETIVKLKIAAQAREARKRQQ